MVPTMAGQRRLAEGLQLAWDISEQRARKERLVAGHRRDQGKTVERKRWTMLVEPMELMELAWEIVERMAKMERLVLMQSERLLVAGLLGSSLLGCSLETTALLAFPRLEIETCDFRKMIFFSSRTC